MTSSCFNFDTTFYSTLFQSDLSISESCVETNLASNRYGLVDRLIRPQFVDILFTIRLRPNFSIHRVVIINYLLVHKIEIENLVL